MGARGRGGVAATGEEEGDGGGGAALRQALAALRKPEEADKARDGVSTDVQEARVSVTRRLVCGDSLYHRGRSAATVVDTFRHVPFEGQFAFMNAHDVLRS